MNDEGSGGRVRRLWGGEVPLAAAFWRYGIAYGTALNAAATAIALAIVAAGQPAWIAVIAMVIPIPYNLFAVVAVWRSAARWQGPSRWPSMARAGIVAWAAVATFV